MEERDELVSGSLGPKRESDGGQPSDGGETKDDVVGFELVHEEVDGVEGVWVGVGHGGVGAAGG